MGPTFSLARVADPDRRRCDVRIESTAALDGSQSAAHMTTACTVLYCFGCKFRTDCYEKSGRRVATRISTAPYFFFFIVSPSSRWCSIAGLSPKSSSSNTWRISISLSPACGFGQRFIQSIASCFDLTWMIQ
jgi:hypothetical protein